MTQDIERRSILRRLGGGPTLAAGFGFVLLQLLLFTFIWLTLRTQDTAAMRADSDVHAAAAIQQLLRGVNECAVTEGTKASRAIATEALRLFDTQQSRIDLQAVDKASGVDWNVLKSRVQQYLASPTISPSDVESMILLGKISGEASKFLAELDKSAALARTDYATAQTNTRLLLAAAALLSLLGTAGIFFMFYRRVTLPLQRAVEVAARLASGNLTRHTEARTSGEAASLMRALESLQSKLGGIVAEVRSTTASVVDASTQVAAGNTDLSARTEQQASTLEETASSMEQFSSTIKQTAESMRRADSLALSASQAAANGSMVASSAVMKIAEVNKSAKRISEIIGVIDGIAFQTNVLALNAAVEAARAGEQGRGFAVVANEVRSLAQRSAEAAKEIKILVATSQMHVEEGTTLVNNAGKAMDGVVEAIHQVTQIFGEITVASREQSSGIDQVAHAVAQMETVTQQNAALVQQSAAAAESMREQANVLAELVSRFTLDESAEPPYVQPSPGPVLQRGAKSVREPKLTARRKKLAPPHNDDWVEF